MLTSALQYAAFVWSVFPVHHPLGQGCSCGQGDCTNVGKHPRTYHGVKDASTDLTVIRNWWHKWPDSNIGLHVGQSGLVVIDIDPRHGGRLDQLPLAAEDLITPMAKTGGDGWHLIYRAPIGFEISNSGKDLPEGIDVRAGNGYIIAPPSLHQSGQRYTWLPGRAPWEFLTLPLPASLMPLLKVKSAASDLLPTKAPPLPPLANQGPRSPYIEKALFDELDHLAQAREGNRNNALNKAAFNLAQFIEAGLLSREEVETLLQKTARAAGLGEAEIQKTISSGISAGLANPRRSWPDLAPTRQQRQSTNPGRMAQIELCKLSEKKGGCL